MKKPIELKYKTIRSGLKKYHIEIDTRKPLNRNAREKLIELEDILLELNQWVLPKKAKGSPKEPPKQK